MSSLVSRIMHRTGIIASALAGVFLGASAASAQLPPPDFRVVTIDQGSPVVAIGPRVVGAVVTQDFFLPERLLLSGIRFWTVENAGFDGTVNWAIHDDAGGLPGQVRASGVLTSGYTKTATGRVVAGFNWPEYVYNINIPPVALPGGPLHLALRLNGNCFPFGQVFWSPPPAAAARERLCKTVAWAPGNPSAANTPSNS